MTDPSVAARLRELLTWQVLLDSDDAFREGSTNDIDAGYAAQREVLIAALLPLLSSLLEEREREVFAEAWDVFDKWRQGIRSPELLAHPSGVQFQNMLRERMLLRLASSSSPAAPQEQK